MKPLQTGQTWHLAPVAEQVTAYDQAHFLTYARILDADADGIGWASGARIILGRDVDADPEAALACWDSHVKRAHWIANAGFSQILNQSIFNE